MVGDGQWSEVVSGWKGSVVNELEQFDMSYGESLVISLFIKRQTSN